MPSFTIQTQNIESTGPLVEIHLAIDATLESVLKAQGKTIPNPVPVLAMIDTGATATVIREDLAQILGIKPVGQALVTTPSSAYVPCYEYLIRVLFPNGITVETTAISASMQGQPIQCLIGRDVLKHGVFIYTGYTNTFTLCF
jgi:predicted aspartyl protease